MTDNQPCREGSAWQTMENAPKDISFLGMIWTELKLSRTPPISEISRFEVITPAGRQLVYYAKTEYQIQDEGRTLKVFLERIPQWQPETPISYEEQVEKVAKAIADTCRFDEDYQQYKYPSPKLMAKAALAAMGRSEGK